MQMVEITPAMETAGQDNDVYEYTFKVYSLLAIDLKDCIHINQFISYSDESVHLAYDKSNKIGKILWNDGVFQLDKKELNVIHNGLPLYEATHSSDIIETITEEWEKVYYSLEEKNEEYHFIFYKLIK